LSTFDAPERRDIILGGCDLIEEIIVGEDKMIKFSGCKKVNKKRKKKKN
jgi:T-complex protein 1 subunit beta